MKKSASNHEPKMKEVTGNQSKMVILDKGGMSASGTYLGNRQIKGKYGQQTVYDFHDERSDFFFCMPGSFDLDQKMEKVPKDSFVRITLQQFIKVKGRKQLMKVWKVEVAESVDLKRSEKTPL